MSGEESSNGSIVPARARIRGRGRIAPPRVPESTPPPPTPWFRRALIAGCLLGIVGLAVQHRSRLAAWAPTAIEKVSAHSPGVGKWLDGARKSIEENWADLEVEDVWAGTKAKVVGWWRQGKQVAMHRWKSMTGPGIGDEDPTAPATTEPTRVVIRPDDDIMPGMVGIGHEPGEPTLPGIDTVDPDWDEPVEPDEPSFPEEPDDAGSVVAPTLEPRSDHRGRYSRGHTHVAGAEGLILRAPDGTALDLHPHSRFRQSREGLVLLSGGALVQFPLDGGRVFLPGRRRVEGADAFCEVQVSHGEGSVDVLGASARVVEGDQEVQLTQLERLDLGSGDVGPVPEAEAATFLRRLAWFGSRDHRSRAPMLAVELALRALHATEGTSREPGARRALEACQRWADRIVRRRKDEAFARL